MGLVTMPLAARRRLLLPRLASLLSSAFLLPSALLCCTSPASAKGDDGSDWDHDVQWRSRGRVEKNQMMW